MTSKLLEHFQNMQAEANAYIMPDSKVTDRAFITTMLRMLDGHEQRAAIRQDAMQELSDLGQMMDNNVGISYIKDALRTESALSPIDPTHTVDEKHWTMLNRLLHAGMGMSTESGEFLDALKKHFFYGKPLDTTNLKEEIGDLFWYLAIACDALGTDFETEMARNIAKLRARYPDKFTSEKAIERDLEGERKVLEDGR